MEGIKFYERELTQDELRKMLKRPSGFGYHGENELLFVTWSIGPVVRTRDSDKHEIARCNQHLFELESHEEWNDQWAVENMGHWAFGWVDHLTFQVIKEVPKDGKPMEPTEICKWIWQRFCQNSRECDE